MLAMRYATKLSTLPSSSLLNLIGLYNRDRSVEVGREMGGTAFQFIVCVVRNGWSGVGWKGG